jgi:signal transduction histidine kinase
MNRLPHGEALDRVVAACLVVLGQIELWVGNAVPVPKGLAAPLMVVMPCCIALRRRRPLFAGCVVLLCNTVLILAGGPGTAVAGAVSWMCGLYGIAVWTDARGFITGLGVLVGGNAADVLGSDTSLQNAWLFTAIPGIAMLLVRRVVRDRELRAETLAARAELLEREHELRANEAVAEERARIARELHDLVAHNVSVMVVQAGVERHALGEGQDSTRDALSSIEQAGRQALVEARRLLGMLRRNGDHEELEPQPSVDQIEFLVEQVERAGLPVTLGIEGERVALPPGVDLCAYRIVQEGLTNVLKHAGPARAEVLLRYAGQALDVEVRDDGRGPAEGSVTPGHGLIGMRERVAVCGGRLDTGPRAGGGFEIRAHLPLG